MISLKYDTLHNKSANILFKKSSHVHQMKQHKFLPLHTQLWVLLCNVSYSKAVSPCCAPHSCCQPYNLFLTTKTKA
jgi:hypothetical protein